MNPVQNTATNDDNQAPVQGGSAVSSGAGKEHEVPVLASTEVVSEIGQEVELPKEVERAGVEVLKETIELPPDVKKLGVTPTGPSAPAAAATIPPVVLPISDQQVVAGLHVQILNSLRWLAEWCIKKLKKAHITLKNIHGKIIRIKT